MSTKAIFFDRDGTLNVDVGYLYKFEQFEWLEGAIDTIKFCNENDYLVIVITNQSGVARGMFTEEDVQKLHQQMNEDLKKYSAHIDDFFYCPHHPQAIVEQYKVECECRKPKSKMIEDACVKYDIDKSKSLMIGDRSRDVECGINAGVKSILFEGGNLFDKIKSCL